MKINYFYDNGNEYVLGRIFTVLLPVNYCVTVNTARLPWKGEGEYHKGCSRAQPAAERTDRLTDFMSKESECEEKKIEKQRKEIVREF